MRNAILGLALYLTCAGIATAQNQDSIQDLKAQIQQLRQESLEMRQQLEAMRQELNALRNPQSSAAASPNSNVVNIAEEQELHCKQSIPQGAHLNRAVHNWPRGVSAHGSASCVP